MDEYSSGAAKRKMKKRKTEQRSGFRKVPNLQEETNNSEFVIDSISES